eukprot:2878802-Pyramimonas_sp.AAC.1
MAAASVPTMARLMKVQPSGSRATFGTASRRFQQHAKAFRSAAVSTSARRYKVSCAAADQNPMQSSQML